MYHQCSVTPREVEAKKRRVENCDRLAAASSLLAVCVVIIDCFEIFIERPMNLKARAQTWSNYMYKHHNTVKFSNWYFTSMSHLIHIQRMGWKGI